MEETLKELWNAAKQAGPFGAIIGAIAWWIERKERIKLQDKLRNMLEAGRIHFEPQNTKQKPAKPDDA